MVRSRRVALVAGAAMLAAAIPAVAQVRPVSTAPPTRVAQGVALSAQHPLLGFHGQMHNPTPLPTVSNPDPTACVNQCELWSLKVATSKPFLVSIHNGNSSIDDGFNLYVYDPSGDQVVASNGIGANGQAAVVTPSGNGVYTIAVTMTYAYDAQASYVGEARLMTRPTWDVPQCKSARPCDELPVLAVRPPSDVHVDGIPPVASTPLGFPFPVNAGTPNSCYVDETLATHALRCLRFTSEVDNVGAGPLTLRIRWAETGVPPRAAIIPGECEAQQVIRRTDGSTRHRDAGGCTFHAQHGHFHYLNFVEFTLHKVNPDGTTGHQVAKSLKESFCLADDGYFGYGSPGPNGPRDYVGQPGCNVPSAPTTTPPKAWVTMGVSPGWGDIYTWDTPSQYIDVTHTPPGVYDIVSIGNPAGKLAVAGPAKTCAATRIRLTDASVKLLKSGIPCD
jgi:hypothetical protein